jgi:hypothetical protein
MIRSILFLTDAFLMCSEVCFSELGRKKRPQVPCFCQRETKMAAGTVGWIGSARMDWIWREESNEVREGCGKACFLCFVELLLANTSSRAWVVTTFTCSTTAADSKRTSRSALPPAGAGSSSTATPHSRCEAPFPRVRSLRPDAPHQAPPLCNPVLQQAPCLSTNTGNVRLVPAAPPTCPTSNSSSSSPGRKEILGC